MKEFMIQGIWDRYCNGIRPGPVHNRGLSYMNFDFDTAVVIFH